MSQIKVRKGDLLLARPSINNDIFNRSVVLIVEHNDQGSLGFIINKFIENTNFNESIVQKIKESPLYLGGPVEIENLYFLHNRPDLIKDNTQVTEGVYWSGNFESLTFAIDNNLIEPEEYKFFIGYCGWNMGQLNNEIQTKEWEVIKDSSINIFEEWNNNLWKKLLKNLGGENLLWINTPINPSLN